MKKLLKDFIEEWEITIVIVVLTLVMLLLGYSEIVKAFIR